MLIGNRYSNDKIYKGIKYYDGQPLTSGDLHEYADLIGMKNAILMDALIGSGTLNEPTCTVSDQGITLSTPTIILLDGDIFLAQSYTNNAVAPIVSKSSIISAGFSKGLLCLVGWYQHLTSTSTLRYYGGVNNSSFTNDIEDETLDMQVSTRYQLRWDTVILDYDDYVDGEAINFNIPNRDESGATTSGNLSLSLGSSTSIVREITKPASMTYSSSNLYIIPILEYTYSNSTISGAKAYKSIKPTATPRILDSSETEASELVEGDMEYDSTTKQFKIYVDGVGLVPVNPTISLSQLTNSVTIDSSTAVSTNSNIDISIGIAGYTNSNKEILQVLYNGVVLTAGTHYTIQSASGIRLLNTTTEVGDVITFIVTKLVESVTVG